MAVETSLGSLSPPAATLVADAVALPPLSEGAAIGPDTVTETVLDDESEALALDWFSIFIVRGTWKASRPSRSTPPTAAMIFCRLALALGSKDLAISRSPPASPSSRSLAERPAVVVVVGVVVVVAGAAPLAPVAPVAGAGTVGTLPVPNTNASIVSWARICGKPGGGGASANEIESIANSRPLASSAP